MTKLDITKFSKYELNFKFLEKDSSGCSIFIFSMFLVLHRARDMALCKHSQPVLVCCFCLMVEVCNSYQKAMQGQKAQMVK